MYAAVTGVTEYSVGKSCVDLIIISGTLKKPEYTGGGQRWYWPWQGSTTSANLGSIMTYHYFLTIIYRL